MKTNAILAMVEDLASTDPAVRDEQALAGLADALLGPTPISDDLAVTVHEHALRPAGPLDSCGEPEGGDRILGRSFTLELLAILHSRDNTRRFLSEPAWRASLDALTRIANYENDFRARVPGFGWAHVVAHASDLADELLASPLCHGMEATTVLADLATLVRRSPMQFAGEEEDRLALTLAGAIQRRQLTVPSLVTLISAPPAWPEQDPVRINWKSVVRSLAFRLDPLRTEHLTTLVDVEKSLTSI